MRRITALQIGCLILVLSACARPDKGPSPFAASPGAQAESLPPQTGPVAGPDFQILPDTRLVYGSGASSLSFQNLAAAKSSLAVYSEAVDEVELSGIEIVEKISREYSLDPRLLLALLEYQTGGVTGTSAVDFEEFVFIDTDPSRAGLFRQLSWAANELNRGFYTRRVGGLKDFTLLDGTLVAVSPRISDASAAVQYLLGKLAGFNDWQLAVGPLGVSADFASLFGFPKADSADPPQPNLSEPELILPFETGTRWFFTSGPHSAWGDGAAWAALDFAPDEGAFGCYDSFTWVTAAADGLVLRSADGQVLQDLDGDGDEGTGWVILYMHIATADRAAAGVFLKAGEKIGHPSCEGGPATGTHLHIARKYNGEWIPADQDFPFNLSGWVSKGDGVEYDGSLNKGGLEITASGFPTDENTLTP